MSERTIGLLGATSLVGQCLISKLSSSNRQVVAFSRKAKDSHATSVVWRQLYTDPSTVTETIEYWICVAPIWVLPACFPMLEAYGIKRIVVLSSTSRFTKSASSDPGEREIAHRIIEAEEKIREWAARHEVKWIILRPTLIYGCGRDKNISEIAQFIRRFGFFPLFGKAEGLRQPVHAADVAEVCLIALHNLNLNCHGYNIPGGETITYYEMVRRIFAALGRPVRLVTVPMWAFSLSITLLRLIPRYRHWSSAMAERMNRDMVFDSRDAISDLMFQPRMFRLIAEDLAVATVRDSR